MHQAELLPRAPLSAHCSMLRAQSTLLGCSSTPSVAEHYLVVRQSSREQKAAGTLHRSIYRWMASDETSRRAGRNKYHHSTEETGALVKSFWGIWEPKPTGSTELLTVPCQSCTAWEPVVGPEHPDWHITPSCSLLPSIWSLDGSAPPSALSSAASEIQCQRFKRH